MALFVVTHNTTRTPAEAWERLTDWPRHGRYVPLTTITVPTPPPPGVGTTFVAHTGVGRLGFDDPMTVTEWEPPVDGGAGRCRLEKQGRVALGWAELTVEPIATGTRASWREDISIAHLPRLADGATAASSRLLFGRVLRRLLED
jgi:hypothetical protein